MMWVSSSFGDGDIDVKPAKKSGSIKSEKRPFPGSSSHGHKVVEKEEYEGDLWVEVNQPISVADLAVHPKKVAQVQEWLKSHVLSGPVKDTPILLLTGPPGAGKTATLKLLARQESLEVQEWVNPVTEVHQLSADDPTAPRGSRQLPQATVFKDFLLRASQFTSLCMAGAPKSDLKLVLVEDFPNVFYRDRSQFHDVLRHVREVGCFPVVFIVSETSGNDSRVRDLFPSELQLQLKVDVISFNAVAATNMQKALSCVLNKEAARRSSFKRPDKDRIQEVVQVSAGDIRSAVNLLQFSSLRVAIDRTSKVLKKASTSKGNMSKSTTNKHKPVKEKASAEQNGGKDISLFLFRALGKILYCKRSEEEERGLPPLPPHLWDQKRLPMLIEPETVVHACPLSAEALCLFLQQNYPEFISEVTECETVTRYLSDADVVSSEWSARDTLSHYGVSVATRGLMHAKTAVSKGGWRPLYKPEWYSVQQKFLSNRRTAVGKYVDQCLPAVELFTQKLPFLNQIHPSRNTKPRFTASLRAANARPQKLEETEAIFDEEDGETQALPSLPLQQCTVPNEIDDEVIIEEYDSD
ncbi:cell cycle checkpoint protein RAD17-like [Branchiostoma lanceolatum]|uniref:cell cycle checkpoint protein RAD17-like n=1 Tax=Branchiostoma lanceolatum TaxID=7740 RepID=UPI0034554A88